MKAKHTLVTVFALAAIVGFFPASARADAVTDWNTVLGDAQKASGQMSSGQSRSGAIVHAAIFDAINGIARKYSPYFVDTDGAPNGADAVAAGVQAAYTTCLSLYPAQAALFDAQLATSLAGLSGTAASVNAGRAWGESVAQQILAWRSTDGLKNVFTYLGTPTQPGVWRTAGGVISGVNVNLATMVPFTMTSPAQFRLPPPYGSTERLTAIRSAAYAADVNEARAYGGADLATTLRTPEQAEISKFWNAISVADQNRVLRELVPPSAQLVDNARLFALCNLAAGDASIAMYDTKYAYALWRPIDAIRLADTDSNAATEPDPTWNSLLPTPRHPEYPSASTTLSSAMFGAAALLLGDEHTFTLSTPGYPSVTRDFTSFTAAAAESAEARIWIGFHFRSSCEEGLAAGYSIALNAVENLMRPGNRGMSDEHRPWHGGPNW